MKHKIEVIFGKEQVNKFENGINFSSKEKEINLKKYSFDSREELKGFIRGLDKAVGWTELYVKS